MMWMVQAMKIMKSAHRFLIHKVFAFIQLGSVFVFLKNIWKAVHENVGNGRFALFDWWDTKMSAWFATFNCQDSSNISQITQLSFCVIWTFVPENSEQPPTDTKRSDEDNPPEGDSLHKTPHQPLEIPEKDPGHTSKKGQNRKSFCKCFLRCYSCLLAQFSEQRIKAVSKFLNLSVCFKYLLIAIKICSFPFVLSARNAQQWCLLLYLYFGILFVLGKTPKFRSKLRKLWKNKSFAVSAFTGHNDVVCDVAACSGWLVSAR